MKFFSAAIALFAAFTVVTAELEARACVTSTCRCNGITGLFCGDAATNPACVDGHVFQCNKSGATCDFGVRTSCKTCNELTC